MLFSNELNYWVIKKNAKKYLLLRMRAPYQSRSQNLRNVGAITILNDGRKPSIRRFLWELSRFLKTCRIV
ncbi:hypothetical protein [Leptospira borgpetersenii]|uniref:hypothetical protein n=1 Tax=Leptospira borgpetersenii TaxID=174 RepID=UPI001A0B245B|nr:hypothetical protein [Leptospira borgpetersenii]MBE8435945.1 hypothetical protein [Leptospira borgpetersenii serovar Tarassovi]UVA64797.1 hypothetical protein LH336_03645 [Leptospira borgpetersenii]